MAGNANVELVFAGPGGVIQSSRPSRLWAQVSDPVLLARRRERVEGDGPEGDRGG
jgi:hypothetical protein